ncbi:MAG: rnr [Alphaproteobacteria bacterium]|nr:rnr [Alphaproteobacteria bacterium]
MKKENDTSGTTPGKPKKPAKSPPKLTQDEVLAFVASRNGRVTKAEIARKFGVTGNDRIGLKHVLKEMLARGTLHHGTFRSYVLPGQMQKKEDPVISTKGRNPGTKQGDFSLAKGSVRNDRRVERNDRMGDREEKPPTHFIGLYEPLQNGGGMVNPVSRQDKNPIMVGEGKTKDARSGDLVRADFSPRGWSISEVLADRDDAGMVSLMAIKTLDIPDVFSPEVMAETQGISVPSLGKRTDLRDVPLVTIDGDDSRDFDDAVYAIADDAEDNKGGWKITVAIADVAHYVKTDSALDREALKRGNSVYFPDRVVPMLPEALSNDLCSLRPHEERACMAALMRINENGHLVEIKIVRGLMKSVARLTYTEVQEALDGQPNEKTAPLLDTVIKPLYGAYKTLAKARADRGTVELDLPERRVFLKNGMIEDIISKPRYDSHKLIEELMILANVAVATMFEEKKQEALYRIHPKPDASRWASTREFLQELGLKTKPGLSPKPADLQALLDQVVGRDEAPLVNDIVLRSMSQASYSPENIGHFGLALENYSHFTSPIRRYADLIVHRALIKQFHLGNDGLTDAEEEDLVRIGEHISQRERIAQVAERDTINRYIALFLEDKIGATFAARVSGVTRFGLFVNVDPMGADGLIPVRTLPEDYYIHDEKRHSLVGRRNGLVFRLAMPLTVRLLEVEAGTGRLLMELLPGQFGTKEPTRERRFLRRDRPEDRGERSRSRDDRGGGRRR